MGLRGDWIAARPRSVAGSLRSSQSLCFIGIGLHAQERLRQTAWIVAATLQTKPKGSTHWSCRTMARAQQVSPSTINRLWQDYNLKPHRTRSFKLSRDVRFLVKMTDVVGLYLNPPDRSLVLCIGEKSQIQALDRTQPGVSGHSKCTTCGRNEGLQSVPP